MIALSPIKTNSILDSSDTSGLPAAYDYATIYCDNTAYSVASSQERDEEQSSNDLTEVAATNAKTACGKNLALRDKALRVFRDRCYPFFSLDEIALGHKPKDIRDYITLQIHPFNNTCHRDLSVRGGSKDFWESVIKWCEVYPYRETNTPH
ncbi:hypothetical protein [Nostoc sp.]|uniref:hypothetical protein n=1 Tax=Nostoc sp. TaxID=1180 RepID=UPI002FF6284B